MARACRPGSFRAAGRYEIASGPTKSAAADVNGDGSAEVLVASYAGGEVAVLVGGDTPLLHRIEIVGSPYGLATGDFNGDGRLDFAASRGCGERRGGLRQCLSVSMNATRPSGPKASGILSCPAGKVPT